jgi:anti-sigma-K factor RskA
MKPHDEFLDNVAAYALGSLSPEEVARVESHLLACEQCAREYESLRPVVTAIARSAEIPANASGAAVPGPLLKARIMRAVRSRRPQRQGFPAWVPTAVAAAAVIVAFAFGVYDATLSRRLGEAQATIARQRQIVADLGYSQAKRYAFANGAVLVAGNRMYIAARDLAPLAAGKVYQTWTLAKGATTVAPSVTFTPNEHGMAFVRVPVNAASTVAVAISVEPAGGSKSPTSKPIALVKLGG